MKGPSPLAPPPRPTSFFISFVAFILSPCQFPAHSAPVSSFGGTRRKRAQTAVKIDVSAHPLPGPSFPPTSLSPLLLLCSQSIHPAEHTHSMPSITLPSHTFISFVALGSATGVHLWVAPHPEGTPSLSTTPPISSLNWPKTLDERGGTRERPATMASSREGAKPREEVGAARGGVLGECRGECGWRTGECESRRCVWAALREAEMRMATGRREEPSRCRQRSRSRSPRRSYDEAKDERVGVSLLLSLFAGRFGFSARPLTSVTVMLLPDPLRPHAITTA